MTAKAAVYIPTRGRPECALKAAVSASSYGLPVYIVTERENSHEYRGIKWPSNTGGLTTPNHKTGGIGYVRAWIMNHAAEYGYKVAIQIDDDQVIRGDVAGLAKLAEREDVMGIGTWKSVYGLMFQGTRMAVNAREHHIQEPGLFLHRGSLGYQVMALNVANVMKAGNFDKTLRAFEDVELCRAGMNSLFLPWMIYTGAQGVNQMSTKDIRAIYGGGCGDDEDVRRYLHGILHTRWPTYVSSPLTSRYRMSWKKMFRECVLPSTWPPEDVQTFEAFDWLDD